MARYFGVSQASIMKLAGLQEAELDEELLQGVDELVRDVVGALNAEELNEWLQYGDLFCCAGSGGRGPERARRRNEAPI